jgi:hypothetical protein
MRANSVSNAVERLTGVSDPSAWWDSYCEGKTSKSDCEAVWVVSFKPAPISQPNVIKYRGATLPYNTTGGPSGVGTAACCEWTSSS